MELRHSKPFRFGSRKEHCPLGFYELGGLVDIFALSDGLGMRGWDPATIWPIQKNQVRGLEV
jgi:hypothetical protein